MRVEGEAHDLYEELFPHGLVPQILRLLVDTWETFQRPVDNESEPKITNRFVVALQRERRRRRAQFSVRPHEIDLEGLDPATGKGYVEIDICIRVNYEDRCYFGIEAKKLNVTSPKGASESKAGVYAGKEGMGCFIDGRYAGYQCEGAMVGYVMDSECAKAKRSISEAIDKRAGDLRVPKSCPLRSTEALPGNPDAFETRHNLDRGEFTIYHVLLAA
ncbi:MAG: hypothetical protein IID33_15610 [Planctomycetes bacterium]|nr:hypothetical protein [Planctomycetota bacterium]